MKDFMKRHKTDWIVLGIVLLLVAGSLIPYFVITSMSVENLIASIYRRDELLMQLDLSKEDEERVFVIEGIHSEMEIAVKHNAIKVLHSDCPGQDCVHMGYRDKPGAPIVCAYNGVSIVLEGGDPYSVTIG